ncbi:phage protein Gp36 family protein [Chroococcidiopsis sp.]|uniref:phage protein Gp36 family protein n=1 Tax=Chroococcidiopsis sp. TaxID=3088168 RepID=UPI003F3E6B36
MPYSTPEDFEEQYTETESAELASLDDFELSALRDRLKKGIDKADGEINTILGNRFVTPISPTPPFLVWASVAITRKILHSYEKSEAVIRDYEDVIERLERIGSGKDALIGSDGKVIVPKNTEVAGETNSRFSGTMHTGRMRAYVPRFGALNPNRDNYSERERFL